MITPAYAPTATERVLPRLALDFTTASLDPRVTITRALNTATRFNSSGFVETVNADQPRFDYNPLTLQCRGLLIEETRQNLLLQSQAFTSPWSIGTSVLLTPNATISPDGTQNAVKLIENTNTGGHQLVQAVATTATATAYGVFAKRGERNWLALGITDSSSVVRLSYFDLLNGVKGTTATGVTSSITDVGNGWYWCVCVVGTALAGSNNARIYVTTADNTTSYTGDGTSGIYIWQADLQPGAFMTSPIFTTTTSLTRNADAVSMTGTNFSDWADTTQGTILSEHMVPQFNAANTIFAYSMGSAATVEVYAAIQTAGSNQFTVQNTTNQANFGGFAAGSLNIPQKVCGFYKANSFSASANGVAGGTDVSGTVPAMNKVVFGARNDGARALNGWVRKFAYWPFPLTTAEVTAFSK